MKPEIKARWVAALRSGEYRQGTDYLRRNDCYCCLGVLCDLAVKDGVCKWTPHDMLKCYRVGNDTAILPRNVAAWAGISRRDHEFACEGAVLTATQLNDDKGMSFAQIADLIEAQL